jgi:hypothetical protein
MAGHVADVERVLPVYLPFAAGISQLILHFSCPGASALPKTVSAALTPIAKGVRDCLMDSAFTFDLRVSAGLVLVSFV